MRNKFMKAAVITFGMMISVPLTGANVLAEPISEEVYAIDLGAMEIFSNNSEGGMMATYTDSRDEFLVDNYGNEYSHSFYAGHGSVTYLTNYQYDSFSGTVAFPKGAYYGAAADYATLTIYGDDQIIGTFEEFNNLSRPESFYYDIASYERIRLEWDCVGMNIWEDWGYFATIFDGQFTSTEICPDDGYDDYGGDYADDEGYGYLNDGTWYYISDTYDKGIALRKSASSDSKLLCRLPYGTEFYVEDYDGDWGYTEINGYAGWINLDYAEVVWEDDDYYYDDTLDYEGVMYYISDTYAKGIALRDEPSKDSTLLCRLPYGTQFWVTDFDGDWGYTAINGYCGWVNLDYADVLNSYSEESSDHGTSGFFKDGTLVYSDEYILPESEYRYLSESDISNLTLKGLCYAKNEIYARHGRKFKAKELQSFFNGQDWYYGVYEPTEKNDVTVVSLMNKYESYNKGVLAKAEEKLGMYPVK